MTVTAFRRGASDTRAARIVDLRVRFLGASFLIVGSISALGVFRPARPASPSFQVVSSAEISSDDPDVGHVETVLAVNPRDARNLVAAAIALEPTESVAVYASKDAGGTWKRGVDARGAKIMLEGLDPAVAFDGEGVAYALALGRELAVTKSTDGGSTWGPLVAVPGSAWDRPWISAGPDGRIYLAGKLPVTVFGSPASDIIGVSRSSDGGASFSFPRLFLPAPDKLAVNFVSDLLVLPGGRLLLPLQLFPLTSLARSPLEGTYPVIASDDGGRTFGEPRSGPSFRTFGHAWEGKSLFGLGGARIAVDGSGGPLAGRTYLTWLDAADGFYRVFAASSSDSGATWSDAVRVDPSESETDSSVATVAVDGRGVVGVAWYDRRADPTDGCYQLFFASSTDGAKTFSPGAAVDATLACPLRPGGSVASKAPTDVDPVSSEYRFKNGGDTLGLVGLPSGGFHVAWVRPGFRQLQLWSTRIAVKDAAPARR